MQRILKENDLSILESQSIILNDWTAIIPLAGNGTRLDYHLPKALYPILDRPLLNWILDLLIPHCRHLVLVVSPEGESPIRQSIQYHPYRNRMTFAIQITPKGMADAVSIGLEKVETPHCAVIWGDQIGLTPKTVKACFQAHAARPNAKLTFPTLMKKDPYIDIIRDTQDRIVAVKQAREKEIERHLGENDCGFFLFETGALRLQLETARSSQISKGKSTGEFNLLPILPLFEGERDETVTLQIAKEEEALGLNTPQEALQLAAILKQRKTVTDRISIAIFSGGRGTATITEVLARHPQIDLHLLVNAYDDGLSTGCLRQWLPGILGPSDIRKNFSRCLVATDPSTKALRFLLEYRFPQKIDHQMAWESIEALTLLDRVIPIPELQDHFQMLTLKQSTQIARYCKHFLDFIKKGGKIATLELADFSLGNLFFAGCYLVNNNDFNRSIEEFCRLSPIEAQIWNVTQGENLVLVGLKQDGTFLGSEAEIVSKQTAVPLADIFLLPRYLTDQEVNTLSSLPLREKQAFLSNQTAIPQLNPKVDQLLRTAHLIIYGPGTQHSSLFPSYLTQGIGEAIAANRKAEKIFIANIRPDHEIQSETINTLIEKLVYYLSLKGKEPFSISDLVTRYLFQQADSPLSSEQNYVRLSDLETLPKGQRLASNWEREEGIHLGGKVVEELLSLVNASAQQELKPFPYMVSIVVPALNEEKTVKKVLHDLALLDFQMLGIAKEILLVDGGSSDSTFKLACTEKSIRSFQLKRKSGRGEALRFGIEKAQGNVIVFFPSDGEYNPQDLIAVVKEIVQNNFPVVFASRSIKCVSLSDRARDIYRGNYFGYLMGKYGGILLSVLSLLLFNRFISDPLTGIKAFEARLLHSLKLRSRGVNLETEIIAKLALRQTFILEVPVDYSPRRKKDGKKTTFLDGVGALFAMIRYRWST